MVGLDPLDCLDCLGLTAGVLGMVERRAEWYYGLREQGYVKRRKRIQGVLNGVSVVTADGVCPIDNGGPCASRQRWGRGVAMGTYERG